MTIEIKETEVPLKPEVVEPKETPNEPEAVTVEEFLKLKSTNERLLKESQENKDSAKKFRDLYSTVKTEAELKEKKRIDENGTLEEKYTLLTRDYETLKAEHGTTKTKSIRNAIRAKIASVAPDAIDVDDILRSLPSDSVDVEEDGDDYAVHGVLEGVRKVKEAKPHYFRKSGLPSSVNGDPNREPNFKPTLTREQWEKLPLKEMKARMSEVAQSENQKR